MTAPCDQLAAYVDSELPPDEAEAFSLHLAGCADCRAALHDTLQLVAIEAMARESARPEAPSGPRAAPPARRAERVRRRWGSRSLAGAAAFAAAAVLVIFWWTHRGPDPRVEPPTGPMVIATAEARGLEGRISYTAADRYRRYDVPRAGGAAPGETIPLDTLAQLERRGDVHGVAAAYLLMNDPQRAQAYLDRAGASPDVAADRALVQRAAGQLSEALITLDGVLDGAPRHPQALWNRALVLRDLGLPRSAAAAFEQVAALGEPGWSHEARQRASALTAASTDQQAAFDRLVKVDAPRLLTAPDAITPEVARRLPGTARVVFYNAVRSAESATAVRALAPLATTLDAIYGGTVLADYIERVSHADFTRRAPLAHQFAALVAGQQLDGAATRDYLAAIRAAKQDDLLVGAILLITAANVPTEMIPELRVAADRLNDPWFHLFAVERAVNALNIAGDYAAAEALALPALAGCDAHPLESPGSGGARSAAEQRGGLIDLRCAKLELVLADTYQLSLRLPDWQRIAGDGWARAQRSGDWVLEQQYLAMFAQLAIGQDDVSGTTLPLVRAYAGEVALREPTRCDLAIWYHEMIAVMMMNRIDLPRATAEVAQVVAPRKSCPAALPSIAFADIEAHVLRDPSAGSPDDVAALRAEIAGLRASPSGPGDQSALDLVEGRLLIDRDHAAGTRMLEQAIRDARSLRPDNIDARRVWVAAHSILALDAARAGEWPRVWKLLGDQADSAAPERCALGVVVEDRAGLAVIRDADGQIRGAFDPARRDPVLDPATLVPAALQAALHGCSEVEVLALPPVQGLPGILPAEFAWSYRSNGHPPPASGAPARPRRVVIADATPPAALGLAPLAPWRSNAQPDVMLSGPAATPARALAELADASFVEVHAHGMVKAAISDASSLMLSPDAAGQYALTAGEIRRQPLRGHPVVILAACHAAVIATHRHEAWGLPAAFIAAGARAVIASADVISDAEAGAFFDDLRARIEHGTAPAIALHDTRSQWLAGHPAASWTRSLMVFQ